VKPTSIPVSDACVARALTGTAGGARRASECARRTRRLFANLGDRPPIDLRGPAAEDLRGRPPCRRTGSG
jgi:hypothetical protein